MGRFCSMWATTKSSKVRAAISRTLCSSISSIFITISPQFRVVHGQVLLYVGHHQVLHMNLSCKHFHFHFLFCRFLAFEKISLGGKCVILGGGVVLFRGWRCAFLGGGDVSNLGGGDVLGWSDTKPVFVWFFSAVCPKMDSQTVYTWRCIITLVAFVWLFSTVYFQMFLQNMAQSK